MVLPKIPLYIKPPCMPAPPLSSLLHLTNRQVASLSGQWPAVPAAAHRGPHPQGRPQQEDRLQDQLLTAAAADRDWLQGADPALHGCTARLYCTTVQEWCTVQCSVVYNCRPWCLAEFLVWCCDTDYIVRSRKFSLVVHCQQCSTVHFAVQCCFAQCSTMVHCLSAVLHCTVQCHGALYECSAALHSAVPWCTAWVQYCTAQLPLCTVGRLQISLNTLLLNSLWTILYRQTFCKPSPGAAHITLNTVYRAVFTVKCIVCTVEWTMCTSILHSVHLTVNSVHIILHTVHFTIYTV